MERSTAKAALANATPTKSQLVKASPHKTTHTPIAANEPDSRPGSASSSGSSDSSSSSSSDESDSSTAVSLYSKSKGASWMSPTSLPSTASGGDAGHSGVLAMLKRGREKQASADAMEIGGREGESATSWLLDLQDDDGETGQEHISEMEGID